MDQSIQDLITTLQYSISQQDQNFIALKKAYEDICLKLKQTYDELNEARSALHSTKEENRTLNIKLSDQLIASSGTRNYNSEELIIMQEKNDKLKVELEEMRKQIIFAVAENEGLTAYWKAADERAEALSVLNMQLNTKLGQTIDELQNIKKSNKDIVLVVQKEQPTIKNELEFYKEIVKRYSAIVGKENLKARLMCPFVTSQQFYRCMCEAANATSNRGLIPHPDVDMIRYKEVRDSIVNNLLAFINTLI